MVLSGDKYLMLLCHIIHILQLISSFASQEQKQYASAGAVAEEVLSSVRTVVSFGGEYKEAVRCVCVCVCASGIVSVTAMTPE